jgi:hypothetical protein
MSCGLGFRLAWRMGGRRWHGRLRDFSTFLFLQGFQLGDQRGGIGVCFRSALLNLGKVSPDRLHHFKERVCNLRVESQISIAQQRQQAFSRMRQRPQAL